MRQNVTCSRVSPTVHPRNGSNAKVMDAGVAVSAQASHEANRAGKESFALTHHAKTPHEQETSDDVEQHQSLRDPFLYAAAIASDEPQRNKLAFAHAVVSRCGSVGDLAHAVDALRRAAARRGKNAEAVADSAGCAA